MAVIFMSISDFRGFACGFGRLLPFGHVVCVGFLLVGSVFAQTLKLQCSLPFEGERHEIDKFCGPEGSGSSAAVRQENLAKNNFCASNPPVGLLLRDFAKLQETVEAAGIPFGSPTNPPLVRGGLKSFEGRLGEGTLVRVVAFVSSAHYADVMTGESANCRLPGPGSNDIHIALGDSVGALPCSTIIAEISPHMRPREWTPEHLVMTASVPVRVTGQLFFDSAHRPCGPGTHDIPRSSIWEIHPVYGLDVCRSPRIESCIADDDTVWVSLGSWSPPHIEEHFVSTGLVHEKSLNMLQGPFNDEVAIWVGDVSLTKPYPVLVFLANERVRFNSATAKIPEDIFRQAVPNSQILLDQGAIDGHFTGFFKYREQIYKLTGESAHKDNFAFKIARTTLP